MTDFLFTVPSGEPVTLEPFHYAITGQTQFSGKTTLVKSLAEWAAELGYKVLIFDTKETVEDYAGFGHEVPVCLRETTDSFVLIGLLESMFRRRLTPYYATLSRISEGAQGFDDIISRAKQYEAKTRSSWLKDACRILYDLLERLKAQTVRVETVPQLQLDYDINRMVINEFSLEAQQLIVKNAYEDLLRVYKRKTIPVIDEAFKFIPQGYSSAATRAIMNVITQGAKTGLYCWISTQFLAVTDKDPLKACAFKFLGTQDHPTEQKHTLELIPGRKGKYTADDVANLKLGHFILVRKRPRDVRVVYALPHGVPGHIGRKVAAGKLTPEYVRDKFLVSRLEEEDELYRQRFEELEKKFKHLEAEHQRLLAERERLQKIPKVEPEEIQRLKAKLRQLKTSHENLREWKDKLIKQVGNLETENAALKQELEGFQEFRAALAKILPTGVQIPGAAPSAETPSEVTVHIQHPAITVVKERQPLTLKQADLEGRIAIVYAEDLLPSDKAFSTRHLNRVMESRFGTKEFPGHFAKVLAKFVAWGYLAKVRAGKRWDYRVKMSPKEAKEKGLLKEVSQ